eukprot:1696250-Pyramimonas_sp.AAC.1
MVCVAPTIWTPYKTDVAPRPREVRADTRALWGKRLLPLLLPQQVVYVKAVVHAGIGAHAGQVHTDNVVHAGTVVYTSAAVHL